MLCPKCYGKGKILWPWKSSDAMTEYISCPICFGHGIIHCCDGEVVNECQPTRTEEIPDDKC